MKFQDLEFDPVWLDSLGAKSVCTYIETPDTSLCIDPGVAVMQPSYPLPDILKAYYKLKASREIRKATEEAEHLTISHYHYDHFIEDPKLYEDKKLWVKNPNKWINKSQWGRSRDFLKMLADSHGEDLEEIKPRKKEFEDPLQDLPKARTKDFGDYQDRREELLEKWRENFTNLTDYWSSNSWIEEPSFVNYADDGFEKGETKVRFMRPLFHGIEYSKTGWVFATIVETEKAKFFHSSDLQGPVIEDHADWIIEEDPDILVLDGPATYLLGYMLNKTNMQRSVDNAARVLKEVDPELMVWDHHLLREEQYRERTEKVWNLKDEGYQVKTAAEVKGEEPLIDRAPGWGSQKLQKLKEKAKNVLGK